MSAESGKKLFAHLYPSDFAEQAKRNASNIVGTVGGPYGERGIFPTEQARVEAIADAYDLRDRLEKAPGYFQRIPYSTFVEANKAIGKMFSSKADYSTLSPEMAEKIKALDEHPEENSGFQEYFKGRGLNIYYTGAPIPEELSPKTERILIFSAHPDDNDIEAGIRTMYESTKGNIVSQLNLSCGAGGGLDRGPISQEAMSYLRFAEMMRSARILGAHMVIVPYDENHLDPTGKPKLGMPEYLQDPSMPISTLAFIFTRALPFDTLISHGKPEEDAQMEHDLAGRIAKIMANEASWTHYDSNIIPDLRLNPPKGISQERVVMWSGEKAFKPNKFVGYNLYSPNNTTKPTLSPQVELLMLALGQHVTQNGGIGYFDTKLEIDGNVGVQFKDSVNSVRNWERAVELNYDVNYLDQQVRYSRPLYEGFISGEKSETLTFDPEAVALVEARKNFYKGLLKQGLSSYDFIMTKEPAFA